MRLFIAFDISPEAEEHLKELQEKLPGKLTLPKNFHLTLKFLGEATPAQAEQVKTKLATISFKPFTAHLDGTGIFPERGIPRVVWIGIEPHDTICALQKNIDEILAPLFPKEKDFKPHLTIARIKKADIQLIEQLKKLPIKDITFEVREFKLIQSKLSSQGAVYKDIAKFQ